MENACELHFERPSFFKRIKGMLGVDFYRLFHTPLLYIFLGIAAIIPALVSMGATGGGETTGMFSNAWQIVAANGPLCRKRRRQRKSANRNKEQPEFYLL